MRMVSPAACYPRLRRRFQNAEEIAGVINRSASYVNKKCAGHGQFTRREELLLLAYLGEPPERAMDYFPEEEG